MNEKNLQKIKEIFPEMYEDFLKNNPDGKPRYVNELLFGEQDIYNKLSPDAKAVLDKATELFWISLEKRRELHLKHPEYNLQAYDASYAQLKLVWKQYFKNEFDDFRKLYKQFEDRMRQQVYELGFLIK